MSTVRTASRRSASSCSSARTRRGRRASLRPDLPVLTGALGTFVIAVPRFVPGFTGSSAVCRTARAESDKGVTAHPFRTRPDLRRRARRIRDAASLGSRSQRVDVLARAGVSVFVFARSHSLQSSRRFVSSSLPPSARRITWSTTAPGAKHRRPPTVASQRSSARARMRARMRHQSRGSGMRGRCAGVPMGQASGLEHRVGWHRRGAGGRRGGGGVSCPGGGARRRERRCLEGGGPPGSGAGVDPQVCTRGAPPLGAGDGRA